MRQILFASIIVMAAILAVGCQNKPTVEGDQANANRSVASASPTSSNLTTVTITSPDGVNLVGSFYPAPNPHSPGLLLLHQWQSDRHSFDEFAKQMQAKGFAVLSIDGRGFGESTKKADGTTIAAGRTDADVRGMLGDVDAAFNYLSNQPNVDPKRIGIVGASYGSSLAIIYAADHHSVASVALLSPGLNYFGNMATEPAIKKYGDRRLYMTAARDDQESADAVDKLAAAGNNPKYASKVHEKGGHGTALFKVGLADDLEEFFTKNSK